MAERRIYWLKLPQDFLDSIIVKKLRQMAGGDTYTIIALKILLKGVSEDNRIYYEGIEDTFAKELALELNESAIDVEIVVEILLRCQWLIRENKHCYLVNKSVEMMDSETEAAARMRKSREKAKNLALQEDRGTVFADECNNVTPMLQTCYEQKEQEKEKEPKEIETEKQKEITSINTCKEKVGISERSEVQQALEKWLRSSGYSVEEQTPLRIAIEDFSEMRKKLRKPLTAKATVLNLNKALELAGGKIDEMAKIFEQSTANGWQGVFALREDFGKQAASKAPARGGKAGFTVEGQTEIEAEEVQM